MAFHPADIESPTESSPAVEAELLARSMIDRWHETRGAKRSDKR